MAIRYEKDYLLRLMQNFFMALDRIINARKEEDYTVVYSELEVTFMAFFEKNMDFFEKMSTDEIIIFFKDDPYPTEKAEMVAMLLFEAGLATDDEYVMRSRLTKVNSLIDYIARERKSISIDHLNKQQYINKMIK